MLESFQNHPPSHLSVEKLSSVKPVPGAKKVGDPCCKWYEREGEGMHPKEMKHLVQLIQSVRNDGSFQGVFAVSGKRVLGVRSRHKKAEEGTRGYDHEGLCMSLKSLDFILKEVTPDACCFH